MKVIERIKLQDGTQVQLEDWRMHNTEKFPNLFGYTIAAYTIAQRAYGHYIKIGEKVRIAIPFDGYRNYGNEEVKADFEALRNGEKTLADLREHFENPKEDAYILGI